MNERPQKRLTRLLWRRCTGVLKPSLYLQTTLSQTAYLPRGCCLSLRKRSSTDNPTRRRFRQTSPARCGLGSAGRQKHKCALKPRRQKKLRRILRCICGRNKKRKENRSANNVLFPQSRFFRGHNKNYAPRQPQRLNSMLFRFPDNGFWRKRDDNLFF